jgi:hypothetical protein
LTQQQGNEVAVGGLGVDRANAAERVRSDMAGERLTGRGQDVQLHGIDTNAAVGMRGQDVDVGNSVRATNASMRNADVGANAAMFGDKLGYLGTVAGIGSKGTNVPFTEQTTTVPGSGGGWFSSTPATPPMKIKTHIPMAPNAPVAPANGAPEIRYGADGKAYTKDPVTGAVIPFSGR